MKTGPPTRVLTAPAARGAHDGVAASRSWRWSHRQPLIETPGEAAASGAGIGRGIGDQGSDGFALKNLVSFAVVIAHSVFVAVTLLTVVVAGGGQVSVIRRFWDHRN
jgi:hypothetical protein